MTTPIWPYVPQSMAWGSRSTGRAIAVGTASPGVGGLVAPFRRLLPISSEPPAGSGRAARSDRDDPREGRFDVGQAIGRKSFRGGLNKPSPSSTSPPFLALRSVIYRTHGDQTPWFDRTLVSDRFRRVGDLGHGDGDGPPSTKAAYQPRVPSIRFDSLRSDRPFGVLL